MAFQLSSHAEHLTSDRTTNIMQLYLQGHQQTLKTCGAIVFASVQHCDEP